LYDNKSNNPVDVKLIIEKVNPSLKLVYFNNITLMQNDSEMTIARFNLNSSGDFRSLTAQNTVLTPYQLKGY
jgi:hypothetical protein